MLLRLAPVRTLHTHTHTAETLSLSLSLYSLTTPWPSAHTAQDTSFQYTPMNFKEGDVISGGDVFGKVFENEVLSNHSILCPPRMSGTVVKVYGDGTDGHEEFTNKDTVLVVEDAHV